MWLNPTQMASPVFGILAPKKHASGDKPPFTDSIYINQIAHAIPIKGETEQRRLSSTMKIILSSDDL
jgi:hypothetical protein